MLEFLKNNIGNIIFVLLLFAGIIVGIRAGYINQVKQTLLYLVTEAEKMYGEKTGSLKFAAVSKWIYDKLPSLCRIFISADTVEFLINKAVEEMKEYLASNKKAESYVLSIKDEPEIINPVWSAVDIYKNATDDCVPAETYTIPPKK